MKIAHVANENQCLHQTLSSTVMSGGEALNSWKII